MWNMPHWDHMMSFGYGGMFMWLILLVLIGVAVYFIVQKSRPESGGRSMEGSLSEESALEIVKKRYARGEITKEEFEAMKRNLES